MIPTKLWYVRTWTVIICYFADHQFCTAWVILKRILIGIYNYTFLPSFATSNQKSCRRQVIDSHQTRFNKFQISESLRKIRFDVFTYCDRQWLKLMSRSKKWNENIESEKCNLTILLHLKMLQLQINSKL